MTDEKTNLEIPELEGEIYYLSEIEVEQSGFLKRVHHGQLIYNQRNGGVVQENIACEIYNPGTIVKIRIQTLSPHFHVGQLYIGQDFEVRKETKTLGQGKITKILRPDFNYWDFESFFKNLPTDCKPYNSQNMNGFIADCDYALDFFNQIGSLKITKSLSNKYQMLTIECKPKDKNTQAHPLIDEIWKIWKEKIQLESSFYKINFKQFDKGFHFELVFATWHSLFLTGKIILNTT